MRLLWKKNDEWIKICSAHVVLSCLFQHISYQIQRSESKHLNITPAQFGLSHHHSSRQETHNECASLRNLKLSLTVLVFSTQAKNKSKQHQATVGRILVRWGASRYQPNRWVDPSLVQGHIGIYISLVFYIVMHTILTDQVLSLVIRMAPLIEH